MLLLTNITNPLTTVHGREINVKDWLRGFHFSLQPNCLYHSHQNDGLCMHTAEKCYCSTGNWPVPFSLNTKMIWLKKPAVSKGCMGDFAEMVNLAAD